jgi:hypothetical protein
LHQKIAKQKEKETARKEKIKAIVQKFNQKNSDHST